MGRRDLQRSGRSHRASSRRPEAADRLRPAGRRAGAASGTPTGSPAACSRCAGVSAPRPSKGRACRGPSAPRWSRSTWRRASTATPAGARATADRRRRGDGRRPRGPAAAVEEGLELGDGREGARRRGAAAEHVGPADLLRQDGTLELAQCQERQLLTVRLADDPPIRARVTDLLLADLELMAAVRAPDGRASPADEGVVRTRTRSYCPPATGCPSHTPALREPKDGPARPVPVKPSGERTATLTRAWRVCRRRRG